MKPILVLMDGEEVLRAVNRLIKHLGVKIKKTGRYRDLGDQRYLSLEPIQKKKDTGGDPYQRVMEKGKGTPDT